MASNKRMAGSRPAVDRGIPVKIVDALIEIGALDESEMTPDSLLVEDLHLDDEDIVELQEELDRAYGISIEDECLDWERLSHVIDSVKRAQSRQVVA